MRFHSIWFVMSNIETVETVDAGGGGEVVEAMKTGCWVSLPVRTG